MNHIKEFESFKSEEKIFTGGEIAEYIREISEEGEEPDFFIDKYVLPNNFKRMQIDLFELLEKDPDFKSYFDSGESRYEDDEMDVDDLNLPIVVFNDVLIDGYNRSSINLRNGDPIVSAYVNIKNDESRS